MRAGVIGHPITHSLSPALHGRWLDRFGLDGTYEAVDPGPDGFAACVARLRAEGWAGCNVTLPFKAEALALADRADGTARRAGAANTLVFAEDGITASNTDVVGFASALGEALRRRTDVPCPPARGGTAISDREGGGTVVAAAGTGLTTAHPPRTAAPGPVPPQAGGQSPGSALVLGAGGTAPAVLSALLSMNIQELRLANRTLEAAEALADRFGATVVPWDDRHDAADADILVNATALGLPGKPPLDIDLSALPPRAVVADCVYVRGGVTPLVAAARQRGLTAIDGLPMLVRQAVPGFAAWYGRTPDDLTEVETFLRGLS